MKLSALLLSSLPEYQRTVQIWVSENDKNRLHADRGAIFITHLGLNFCKVKKLHSISPVP